MLKLVILLLIAEASSQSVDPLLHELRATGKAPVVICLKGAEACPGVLWSRWWVLARASCLLDHSLFGASVIVDGSRDSCPHVQVNRGLENAMVRKVRVRFAHPAYRPPNADEELSFAGSTLWSPPPPPDFTPYNAALVLLDQPYFTQPERNHSRAYAKIPSLERWMQIIFGQFPSMSDFPPPVVPVPYNIQKFKLLSSPVRMFLTTVILPSVIFILFFLFIMCYSSDSSEPEIPYSTISEDGEEVPPEIIKPTEVTKSPFTSV